MWVTWSHQLTSGKAKRWILLRKRPPPFPSNKQFGDTGVRLLFIHQESEKTFPCSEGKPSQNMLKLIFLNQFLNFYLLKENIISLLSETLNATKNKRLPHYTVEMENYRCCSSTSHHCSFKLFLLLKVAYKVSQTHARRCCVTRILVVYTHF